MISMVWQLKDKKIKNKEQIANRCKKSSYSPLLTMVINILVNNIYG